MATKTISIELDVYERLSALRSRPSESFSEVLRRELPGPRIWKAGELRAAIESGKWTGLGLSDLAMKQIEESDKENAASTNPWERP